jgi:tetratricopeptide (TPR) repeat protein
MQFPGIKISFALFVMLWCLPGYGQHKEVLDSLFFELETSRGDSARVSVLNNISVTYSSFDLPLSFQYAEEALKVAESSKSQPLLAQARMSVGNICFLQGLYDLSVKHYHGALNIHKELGNREGIAKALTNLGGVHLQLYKFEESKDFFDQSLQYYLEVSDERGDTIPPYPVVSIYNNLGIAFENLNDFNKAIEYYLRGISLAKRMPSQWKNLAMLYNNIGSSYMKSGRPAEALENMEEALRIRKEKFDKTGEASSYCMIGLLLKGQENFTGALENFNRGYTLAAEVGSTPLLSAISEQLFESYQLQNQVDSALKYHLLFKEFSDQLKNEETLRELTRMEIVSQYQEKERIQQIEQRRRALRQLSISIVLVLSVIIFGLLYFLSQSRLRRLNLINKNIQLASENAELEREALSKELELKNKELTTNVIYQIRKNEQINSIAEKLMTNSPKFRKENQKLINEILKDLENTQKDNIWEEFESRFHQVHNQFYDRLNEINPDLTPNERRLCAFLRLNMSTKEISSITGQSLRSIEVARTRLRKKLFLTNSNQGLIEYLSSL